MRASNPSAHAKRVYSTQHECRYAPHSSAAIRNDHVPPRVARVSRVSHPRTRVFLGTLRAAVSHARTPCKHTTDACPTETIKLN